MGKQYTFTIKDANLDEFLINAFEGLLTPDDALARLRELSDSVAEETPVHTPTNDSLDLNFPVREIQNTLRVLCRTALQMALALTQDRLNCSD